MIALGAAILRRARRLDPPGRPVSRGAARPHTADDWLALVARQEREGGLFPAYDLAEQALDRFPDDLRLKHRAALCLASTRATAQARAVSTGSGSIWPMSSSQYCRRTCGSTFPA